MQSYEVEVKSLLGAPEKADALREALRAADPSTVLVSKHTQLNHYFEDGSLEALAPVLASHLSAEGRARLADFAARAKSFSVRARETREGEKVKVLFVVKASVGDDTSANGVARMELEEELPLSLDALDQIILSAGFIYQAKWSREREEYKARGMSVTLDKNAGYGWLAEFECVVDDESALASARAEIAAFMAELRVQELPQDRLERMFAYYNTHWPEYYGTDKIFTVE